MAVRLGMTVRGRQQGREAIMRPQLIIDNAAWQPAVINYLQAITVTTLRETPPHDMLAMLAALGDAPDTTPSCPPALPPRVSGLA